jgi:hypothetical protein
LSSSLNGITQKEKGENSHTNITTKGELRGLTVKAEDVA